MRLSASQPCFIITLELEKELIKKNPALENQLKGSCDKMDDLHIHSKKTTTSLSRLKLNKFA